MDVMFPVCAGLDVHQKTVVACCVMSETGRQPQRETRTFATMTDDLLALSDWLTRKGGTHVAMEATGVYVRRITARVIPPAGRSGSEGNPRVND
jgi:transposase